MAEENAAIQVNRSDISKGNAWVVDDPNEATQLLHSRGSSHADAFPLGRFLQTGPGSKLRYTVWKTLEEGGVGAVEEFDGGEGQHGLADILQIVGHRFTGAELEMLGGADVIVRLGHVPISGS